PRHRFGVVMPRYHDGLAGAAGEARNDIFHGRLPKRCGRREIILGHLTAERFQLRQNVDLQLLDGFRAGRPWTEGDDFARNSQGIRAREFNGPDALAITRKVVAFGPRPSGSEAIKKLQIYILAQLKPFGCQVTQDDLTASTPLRQTPMKNIIARFSGRSGKAIVITGHYDTKSMPGTYFVGANDGGASAGFLLEFA